MKVVLYDIIFWKNKVMQRKGQNSKFQINNILSTSLNQMLLKFEIILCINCVSSYNKQKLYIGHIYIADDGENFLLCESFKIQYLMN